MKYTEEEKNYLNIVRAILEEFNINYYCFNEDEKGDATICINKIDSNNYKVFEFERNIEHNIKYHNTLNNAVKDLIYRSTDSYEKEEILNNTLKRKLK